MSYPFRSPYRYELWRTHPDVLLLRVVYSAHAPQPVGEPDLVRRPIGYPEGHQWRLFDGDGNEVCRWNAEDSSARGRDVPP
ncbi:MAG TPA: hypothetical protein VGD71_43585 [Kribbella sp.]